MIMHVVIPEAWRGREVDERLRNHSTLRSEVMTCPQSFRKEYVQNHIGTFNMI